MHIYVFGNPLVEKDSLALKLLPELQKKFPHINFIEIDPSEDLPKEKHLILLDAVEGIQEAVLIHDIDRLILERRVSLHDFDLGYNLKLMKKFGMIGKVTIIGIPMQEKQEKTWLEMERILEQLLENQKS